MKQKSKSNCCTALLLCIFGSFPAYSQIELPFVKHLSDNSLHREHLAYLQSPSLKNTPPDSVAYLKAKYYLQYADDSLFFTHYQKSKELFIKDSCAFTKAGIHFLSTSSAMQSRWFGLYDTANAPYFSGAILNTWMASIQHRGTDETKIPIKLREDFLKCKKYSHRSPFLAGALSAAVPGLGKLYAGRKQSFFITLMTHIGYGAQTYEAVRKLGIKHPFSIFSLSFFSAFYAANIYGSYRDLKEVKQETRKQFLINASNYYNVNHSCGLY